MATLRHLHTSIVLSLALLAAGTALAESPTAQLQKARRLMETGEFEHVIRSVNEVLETTTGLPEPMLVEAYRLRGFAQLYLGSEHEARKSYEKLLELDPDYELPKSAPPKIQQIYTRIKETIRRRRLEPVLMEAEPLPELRAEQPFTARARITALSPGLVAKLFYRRNGVAAFNAVDLSRSAGKAADLYEATIPAYDLHAEDEPYPLDYFFEVTDAAQRRLAGKGTAGEPLQTRVLPPDAGPGVAVKAPWPRGPWIWIISGAVVAATTVGIVSAASRPGGP